MTTTHSYVQSKRTNAAKMIRKAVHSVARIKRKRKKETLLGMIHGVGTLKLRLHYSYNRKQHCRKARSNVVYLLGGTGIQSVSFSVTNLARSEARVTLLTQHGSRFKSCT